LKTKLSDDQILNFFTHMMKNDSYFRECTSQLYNFSQEAMRSD